MSSKLKSVLILLPLLLTGFMPADDPGGNTESYYNFRTLKEADAPREMKVVRVDNEKNKMVLENGILITYKNREARQVKISGDFTAWKTLKMERSDNGVWYCFITSLADRAVNRYKFLVDGIWIPDPKNFVREDDGMGSYSSIIQTGPLGEGTRLTYRIIDRTLVEFRVFKPRARIISLVGDFNSWNPENDMLEKGSDGVWRLKKRLYRGTYRYTFIIDGRWTADLYNEKSASDDNGKICSLLKIE